MGNKASDSDPGLLLKENDSRGKRQGTPGGKCLEGKAQTAAEDSKKKK